MDRKTMHRAMGGSHGPESSLDIDQTEVSKLMSDQYHLLAEGRLFHFLNRLNKKVTVKIHPRHRGERPQEVVFA